MTVSVVGRDAAVEELRSLFTWLAGDEEFRGRVRLVETAPEPGTLGGWPEAVVALVQGGAVTVLASPVIAWMRHRTSEVTCIVTRPDGTSAEVTAKGSAARTWPGWVSWCSRWPRRWATAGTC